MCNLWANVLAVVVISQQAFLSDAQLPPRITIPGALLLGQQKPAQFRQQRILQQPEPLQQTRPRRPPPNAFSAPVRPVIEEPEEIDAAPQQQPSSQFLEDEAARLGLAALQSAVRQQNLEEESGASRPVAFRPERPVPLLRSDIREAAQRPLPILRQEPAPTRPPLQRQEFREEAVQRQQPQPVRQVQQVRQQVPVQQPPVQRQKTHQPTRKQQYEYAEGNQQRTRKPPVQILRKYRTDNPDGSITWGYENEDGTFKEETLGVDCITRGKYGYIDPDGVRRDYTYETGLKCDEPEEEEELPPQGKVLAQAPRKQPPPQFRPQSAQY